MSLFQHKTLGQLEFKRRCYELLKIEGWYDYREEGNINPKRIKISCQFHDILRCSEFPALINPFNNANPYMWKAIKWAKHHKTAPRHFISCFGQGKARSEQPLNYCSKVDNVAIIYLSDRYGNFQARCFIWYKRASEAMWIEGKFLQPGDGYYELSQVYGNGLSGWVLCNLIRDITTKLCRYNLNDTYID